jgi:hypothetical protein
MDSRPPPPSFSRPPDSAAHDAAGGSSSSIHAASQSSSSSHAPYFPSAGSKQLPLQVPFSSENYQRRAPDPFLPNPQSHQRQNSYGLNNGRDTAHMSRDSGGTVWSSASGKLHFITVHVNTTWRAHSIRLLFLNSNNVRWCIVVFLDCGNTCCYHPNRTSKGRSIVAIIGSPSGWPGFKTFPPPHNSSPKLDWSLFLFHLIILELSGHPSTASTASKHLSPLFFAH